MKNSRFTLIFTALLSTFTGLLQGQRILTGTEAEQVFAGSDLVRYVPGLTVPEFIRFRESSRPASDEAMNRLTQWLNFRDGDELRWTRQETDKLGMTHHFYQHYYHQIPVEHSQYRTHHFNGELVSVNGKFYNQFTVPTTATVTAEAAITSAKAFVGAETYQWEIPAQEEFIKMETKNPSASFYPVPGLVIISKNADYTQQDFRLAWKIDIYAHAPLSRQNVYVDATTGEVIWSENTICHVDVNGTAATVFSGSRQIVADSFNGGYRLREAGRGNGIETYNLNNGTNYTNTDFVDADNNWINMNPAIDEYALDAHWGAEMTYDYYMNVHNRNSIDGNGFALYSYVHYDVGYGNAFWDSQRMTYGDGGGPFTDPLTSIDIVGHEITHGLTEHTANLIYQDQSGALNESFSDIFGTCIDFFARNTSAPLLWLMGDECTGGSGIRDMSNPGVFGDPDTYGTGNWYTGSGDNGGVHTNSGVQNFWFYLLSQGGTGTNDYGNAYTVNAIGMSDAADIAFRNLSVYLYASADYNDARFYAIRSAEDLFGLCTPEVIATTDAWYAVGVGSPFDPTVVASFTAPVTQFCSVNASVNFTNTSTNSSSWSWDFGDGNTSNVENPSHVYGANGTYNVTLTVTGSCGSDTTIMNGYIVINAPAAPVISDVSTCASSGSFSLTATASNTINWYTVPNGGSPFFTGNTYNTPLLVNSTTYYLDNSVPGPLVPEGPPDNNFGTGGNHNNTERYLNFTVTTACELVSATVYASGAGNRTFELWDDFGNPLDSRTVNVPNGTSSVALNFSLQPGNYRIGGSYMNLYRNFDGSSYPYNVSGLLTITGSSLGPDPYYFLYNWQLQGVPCTSPRIPVNVVIGAQPTASFTSTTNGGTVTFNNTSANGSTYSWDFGDGNTSTQQNPVHTYSANGTYTVTLIVENYGCYDTIVNDITIFDLGTSNEQGWIYWDAYPNPFSGQITITFSSSAKSDKVSISAFDLLGKKLADIYEGNPGGTLTVPWNSPASLPSGVYMIRVKVGEREYVKKVIKQ